MLEMAQQIQVQTIRTQSLWAADQALTPREHPLFQECLLLAGMQV